MRRWAPLAVAILAVVVCLPVFRAGFVFDDGILVTENPLVTSDTCLWSIWASTRSIDYLPLTYTTFFVEWRLWGASPLGYHLANLALHVTAALLLWRVLARLGIRGGFAAALLFAVHPVSIGSAAWIAERKNVLSAVFFLAAVLLHLRHEREARWRDHIFAVLAFGFGLLAKSSIVMLPVILLGLAWWQRGAVTRRDWVRTLPFFALALVLGVVTIVFQAKAIGGEQVHPEGLAARFAGAGLIAAFYIEKALLPVRLSFFYPRWHLDTAAPLSYAATAAILAALAILWARRHHPLARAGLFALGYHLIVLLPVLGFVDMAWMRYALVSDHLEYLALLGASAAGGAIFSALLELPTPWQRRAAMLGPTAALVILAALAHARAEVFVSSETLWRDTIAKNPDAWVANNNLGKILREKGQLDEALACFREAIRANPNYSPAYSNLGMLLTERGDLQGAIPALQTAVRLDPRSIARAILAFDLARTGNTAEAALLFDALPRGPGDAELHYNLGVAFANLGDTPRAIDELTEAARLDPSDPGAPRIIAELQFIQLHERR